MSLLNRLVNPLVRLLLRSPLHPALSRSLVSLPDRKVWWRNLRRPPESECACKAATYYGIADHRARAAAQPGCATDVTAHGKEAKVEWTAYCGPSGGRRREDSTGLTCCAGGARLGRSLL